MPTLVLLHICTETERRTENVHDFDFTYFGFGGRISANTTGNFNEICTYTTTCVVYNSPAGKGLTSWLLFVISDCDFVTFPCDILGQVWYLIVLIPDLCRLPYLVNSVIMRLFKF